MMPEHAPATLGDHAADYARQGFEVFPVNPRDKLPLVSQYSATTDVDQVRRWWQRHPDALIGHRLPADQIVLDVDPRHGGHHTWQRLCTEYGIDARPRTRKHFSGRRDGGGHMTFTRPPGLEQTTIRNLDELARQWGTGEQVTRLDPDTGEQVPTDRWVCGLDILHRGHRYTILPPSPHPETGEPYYWATHADAQTLAAVMPPALAELLTPAEKPPPEPKPPRSPGDGVTPADWVSETWSWNAILPKHGWTLRSGNGDDDGSEWRHPAATSPVSATIRHRCLFVYSPNTPFPVTYPDDPAGVTLFNAYATLDHNGDTSAAASAARKLMPAPAVPATPSATIIAPPPDTVIATARLGDDFYNAREALAAIRDAARSRLVAPDAVLGAVLAHLGARTPPSTQLPAIVGSTATLAVYVALIGASGAGKTAPSAVAADLLGEMPPGHKGPLVLGSGEGIAEAYLELVEETDDDGKKKRVKKQTTHGVLFTLDEGRILAELGARKGSTTLPVICMAWTGGDLGNANASIETFRLVKAKGYTLGLLSLWQPTKASHLLDDAAGGAPQRFLWFGTTDPDANVGATWPDRFNLDLPSLVTVGGELDVADEVRDEIVEHRLAVLRGEIGDLDPLDAHRNLSKLKVAGHLAQLERRRNITTDDWDLAETVMAASDATRSGIVAINQAERAREEQAGHARAARRETIVEDTLHERSRRKMAATVARKVHRENQWPRARAASTTAKRDRDNCPIEDAIEHAEEQGWIVVDGDLLKPGESQPA